jgi:hypothetical protein
VRLELKNIRQADAQHACAAYAEKFAPAETVAGAS